MVKLTRIAIFAGIFVLPGIAEQAFAQAKSDVQRKRCAQIGEAAINTPQQKEMAGLRVVGGALGGGLGGLIGAAIGNSIIENRAKEAATNQCLAKAGLLPKDTSVVDTSKKAANAGARVAPRSTDDEKARNEVGAGAAWMRRSIKSQQ
jgi:hypothetical protein